MQVARLARTVVHLRPGQILGRALHKAPRARPHLRPAPAGRARVAPWRSPAARAPSMSGPDHVRFLNEPGEIGAPDAWNDSRRPLLWLYNLHYFDDLAATGAAQRADWHRRLIGRWIDENPPGDGVGWEPYPTSLRIVNWIKAAAGGLELTPSAVASLAVQARWLAGRLETHLLGNHLLANAKALVFAGLFFEGPEAERWRAVGLGVYADQLPEQVLADGGHFERSPMYHALILEDLLDLANLATIYGDGDAFFRGLPATVAAMGAWLKAMSHPDGRIGFFNDAAFGIAPEPTDLDAYGRRLGLPAFAEPRDGLTHLSASGYVRLQAGPAVALFDAAPVGPDYLPGHAHADTLSLELSVGGARAVVNGGTSVYGLGAQRHAERSTAAHSTVEIDGENSSEVWSGFRVGRRARVLDAAVEDRAGVLIAEAAHDGYRWRPGRPVHRRTLAMAADSLTITDRIDGTFGQAVARFHLAPGVTAGLDPDGRSGALRLPDGRAVAWRAGARARVEASEWRPEFGRRLPTHQLVVPLCGPTLETVFTW
ncbi:heparinase II/III family protein [Phenylobacterium sp.]|uniref:heparinase II/III family protein n=1 Tax=Phenylobacterium sp. TaxID=1871053 RepID=UPI002FE13C11